MVYLGASRVVVCLLEGRSIRVPYVSHIPLLNEIPLTSIASNFQIPFSPTLPTNILSPLGLPP